MAKKRKGSTKHNVASDGPNLDVGESRKRIRDFEDVADSDEEFRLNRDNVLLDEGPEAKRRRKWQEQEQFLEPSDEEVLEYSGSEEEDDVEDTGVRYREDGVASESDGNDEDVEDDEDDDGLAWGTAKDDIYGADEIETEEQALEEEAEALRLQKKELDSMTAADYGFDEADWQEGDSHKTNSGRYRENVVKEVLPQLQVRSDMTPAERLKLLRSRYPEFEPLSKELLRFREEHAALANILQAGTDRDARMDLSNARTKLRAASAYLGALTMYFTLLISPAAGGDVSAVPLSAAQLRDHPLMESLVKCKELWLRAKDLPADPGPIQRMQEQVVNDTTAGNGEVDKPPEAAIVGVRPAKKSRAQRHAEAAQAAADARRAERLQRTEADLANLDDLITQSANRKSSKSHSSAKAADGITPDVEEEAPLTAHEAAEKAKRKKSLRFYTSQIAQKANKRGAAGRNAGGDDDIPYRERLKDRQARLNAQAEKRGRKTIDANADLGGESEEEDARDSRDIRADADDDYYDLIASRTAKKKADKTALVDAKKQALLQGGRVVPEESIGPDGKRKVTYAIETNKGLTPHRKKEVRNPRVKKRKKFDEKKKKLASVKAVYKGGEGRGGYGGELTGIKKGLVKSVKL